MNPPLSQALAPGPVRTTNHSMPAKVGRRGRTEAPLQKEKDTP